MKHLRISLCVVAAIYCFNFSAHAQSFTGLIVGTVKNPEGAVVPNAEITIIHEQTNRTLTVMTNGEGYYASAPLGVGTYRVEA